MSVFHESHQMRTRAREMEQRVSNQFGIQTRIFSLFTRTCNQSIEDERFSSEENKNVAKKEKISFLAYLKTFPFNSTLKSKVIKSFLQNEINVIQSIALIRDANCVFLRRKQMLINSLIADQ